MLLDRLSLCISRQSLDALYTEIGNTVLDSTNDVPFMFHGRPELGQQQRRRQQKARYVQAAGASTARSNRGLVEAAGGRAVLDVAMPGAGAGMGSDGVLTFKDDRFLVLLDAVARVLGLRLAGSYA